MNFPIPKQLSQLTRITYGKRIHPSRDWLALLSVAALLLVVAALWSAWVFIGGTDGATANTPPTAALPVSTQMLEETNALFEERRAEEERYRSEYRFVDPAL